MKKTEKTALTAAIFAAAIHMGTANAESVDTCAAFSGSTSTTTISGVQSKSDGNFVASKNYFDAMEESMATVYGPPSWFEDDDDGTVTEPAITTREMVVTTQVVYGPPNVFTTTASEPKQEEEIVQPVYGPPWYFTTTATEPKKIVVTTQVVYGPPNVFTTTTVEPRQTEFIPQPVYGPPWSLTTTPTVTDDYVIAELEDTFQDVYGPAPSYGDIDYDGKVDVFDLIMLRERFAQNNKEFDFRYDVNLDSKISVADLVTLSNNILGKTKDVTRPDNDVVTTTRQEMAGVYGPPPSFFNGEDK